MREKIAEILGVSVQDLAEIPPEIVDSMVAVFETIPVKNDEDRKIIYSELEKLWAKGIVILGLKEIAERTKIPDITLFSLDYDVQQKLVFEYMADSENVARIFEIIGSEIEFSDLKKIAELIKIPAENLRKLPPEIQKKMCGHYAMEYEENGDNSALIGTLKSMIV